MQTCLFTGEKNGIRKGALPAVDRVLCGGQAPLGSNPGSITYYLVSSLPLPEPHFSPL